ncbi:MAG: hypothetical protein AVDCRST_MAG18-3463 [uncultured Thermomicrobiales bacterium]|uniref:Uncharacterized protein n=1 Tax=uncultured Thermomicrobiales bacterium TaxID=1645740 RepID=A0A6J4VUI3_9BACT|nr:MAG: hypothetical protein AVDCRST_MAG18-3463 [uncultured Thermomicrobiales bacterium]
MQGAFAPFPRSPYLIENYLREERCWLVPPHTLLIEID